MEILLDALNLLQLVQWRRQDTPSYLQATVQLCQFHLKAPDSHAAWKTFERFNTGGGDKMPAATWLELVNAWPPPTQRKRVVACVIVCGADLLEETESACGCFAELQSRTGLDGSTSGLGRG